MEVRLSRRSTSSNVAGRFLDFAGIPATAAAAAELRTDTASFSTALRMYDSETVSDSTGGPSNVSVMVAVAPSKTVPLQKSSLRSAIGSSCVWSRRMRPLQMVTCEPFATGRAAVSSSAIE